MQGHLEGVFYGFRGGSEIGLGFRGWGAGPAILGFRS